MFTPTDKGRIANPCFTGPVTSAMKALFKITLPVRKPALVRFAAEKLPVSIWRKHSVTAAGAGRAMPRVNSWDSCAFSATLAARASGDGAPQADSVAVRAAAMTMVLITILWGTG